MKSHYIYRIFYGDMIVYIGRTNQKLQNRIRGHLLGKPMHRTIDINLVTKIEYSEFSSEADMYVYEIYLINLYKPTLNKDDRSKDALTVNLPDVTWVPFETRLWDKWKKELGEKENVIRMRRSERAAYFETLKEMHKRWHEGEITEEEYYRFKDSKPKEG